MRPDLLRTLGTYPEPDDYKTTLDLDQEPYLDPPALRRYVKRLLAAHDEPNRPASATLTDDQRSRLAATITDAAGNFLVALLTALAVRDAPERTIAYPKSVGEAFDVYLSNFRARRPSVEALFRALAYAEGPGLAATDRAWALIAQAVGDGAFPDEPNLAELERFVASDGAYLVQAGSRQERQRGRVEHVPIHRICHQAIIDHLRADQPEQRERQIFDGLHDAVPGDERQLDWKTAEPYTRRYLVRHALAGHDPDRLDTLLTQPSFCVHADPAAFEPGLLLRTHDPDALAAAYVIGRTADRLRAAADPRERAALLGLSARQARHPQLAQLFDDELNEKPPIGRSDVPAGRARWRCRWAAAPAESPHFTLSRLTGLVNAVALGTLAGEQVIVSGGGEGTVRVWAADGSPRGEPLRGHHGPVSAVALGTLAGEQVIVSGGGDGTVRVWAADGSPLGEPLRAHDGPVNAVAVGTLADGR